jgi:VWFA-related protein
MTPLAAALARAPHQGPAPLDSAGVNAVNVVVTVRDRKGRIVTELTRADFVLEDNDRRQTIDYFARETDLPLTFGLVVDTSLSQGQWLGAERAASSRFFERVLRDDKRQAFLIHFDREAELLQDLTNSHAKLERALEELATPQLIPRGPDRQRGEWQAGGAVLYDAVFLASDELMRRQQGRKALILWSGGEDRGSREPIESALEAAQRAETPVCAILSAGPGERVHAPAGYGGAHGSGIGRGGGRPEGADRVEGRRVMQHLARESGGGYYEVSKKQPIDEIYTAIEGELSSQYRLGYTPLPRPGDRRFHSLHVTVAKKDLVVQCRAGYYPAP